MRPLLALLLLALLAPPPASAYDNDAWRTTIANIAKNVEKKKQLAKEIGAMTKKNNEELDNLAHRTVSTFDPEIELSLVSPQVRKVFEGMRAGGGDWIIGTPGLYELAVQLQVLNKNLSKKAEE